MSSGAYLSSGFLYINMGCHMMFVLKNRLKAQGIPQQKTLKIINDLVSAMFKEHFVRTVLTPQEAMPIPTLKELFRRLAHSSIMKLDSASMEKLLFLIIMTVKKEVFMTSSPLELYSLTLGNLQILQNHTKTTPSELLLQTNIAYFITIVSRYSYMQFMELRDDLLSILETYQTKVVNFVEKDEQTDKGKLIFIRRNTHNEMPLGQGINHPNIKLKISKEFSKQYLALKDWKEWKTSLVIDHSQEYQRQSDRRNQKNQNQYGKEKSLNDLFKIQSEKLIDFEVQLDLFDYDQEPKRPTTSHIQNQSKKSKITPQSHTKSSSKQIKDKIQQQFSNLSLEKQEDLDLLDMMDN